MLCFSQNSQAVRLIFLFLGVFAYLTSNEKSNYSRHPNDHRLSYGPPRLSTDFFAQYPYSCLPGSWILQPVTEPVGNVVVAV